MAHFMPNYYNNIILLLTNMVLTKCYTPANNAYPRCAHEHEGYGTSSVCLCVCLCVCVSLRDPIINSVHAYHLRCRACAAGDRYLAVLPFSVSWRIVLEGRVAGSA